MHEGRERRQGRRFLTENQMEETMYHLEVSYNAGESYQKAQEAETVEELLPKAQEFNQQGLRWTIEDEQDEIVEISSIQKEIQKRFSGRIIG